MQRAILQEILRLIDARISFAIATVVSSSGSVPGKVGFRMLVYPDGHSLGTVGGAGLEEKVKKQALEYLAQGKSRTVRFDLTYRKPGGLDSVCGGSVEVFVEVVKPKPHLLICGGGHVGAEVARLCDQLEYFYSVFDDRQEYASQERFPRARQCYAMPLDTFRRSARLGDFSHIIICGYSYHVDEDLLTYFVPNFSGYIGLIGSATKRKEMSAHLLQRGGTTPLQGLTAQQLERIECPIGVSIGAESPAEIAVSILGRVIQTYKENSLVVNKNG